MLSIVIPTYNGAKKIKNLLESLVGQLDVSEEIIVTVDGSIDNTETVVNNYLPSLPIKCFVQKNKGRAVARNAGVLNTSKPYLLFFDDDMRLSPGCLKKHKEHHLLFPNTLLVGKVSMDKSLLKKDFDYYLADLYEKWEQSYPSKLQMTASNLKFTTQHLSLPRQLFDALGGFDARLTDGEDYDLGMRALEAGLPIYYDPTIVAWHDDFPTCEKYIKRQVEYKRSHARLKELNIAYSHDVFIPISAPTNVLKRGILKILAQKAWVKGIDKGWWTFLQKKWRHKLYASIIYAQTLRGLGLI